jgi:hypothetical protein
MQCKKKKSSKERRLSRHYQSRGWGLVLNPETVLLILGHVQTGLLLRTPKPDLEVDLFRAVHVAGEMIPVIVLLLIPEGKVRAEALILGRIVKGLHRGEGDTISIRGYTRELPDARESRGALEDKDAVLLGILAPAERAVGGVRRDAAEDGDLLELGLVLEGLEVDACDGVFGEIRGLRIDVVHLGLPDLGSVVAVAVAGCTGGVRRGTADHEGAGGGHCCEREEGQERVAERSHCVDFLCLLRI